MFMVLLLQPVVMGAQLPLLLYDICGTRTRNYSMVTSKTSGHIIQVLLM